jgi:hypothetical protein
MKIPQELVVAIIIGVVIVFYLFVILSGRTKKPEDQNGKKKQ